MRLIYSLRLARIILFSFQAPAFKNYIDYMDIEKIMQVYLVLLGFTLLHFEDSVFFTDRRFVTTVPQASLLAPCFLTALFLN